MSTDGEEGADWRRDFLDRLPVHHPLSRAVQQTDLTAVSKRLAVMGRVAPMPTSRTAHISSSDTLQDCLAELGEYAKHLMIFYFGPSEELPEAAVYGAVAGLCSFATDKHCVLPLKRLFKGAQAMGAWLALHPLNVCIVQCGNGVVRSGLAVACFLRFHSLFGSTFEAMQWFLEQRAGQHDSADRRAIHEQIKRYLRYFDDTCSLGGRVPSRTPIRLHQLVVHTVPNFDGNGGCSPGVSVYRNARLLFDSERSPTPPGYRCYMDNSYVVFWFDRLLLYQDVTIRVSHAARGQSTTIFTHAFNTGYLLPGIVRMTSNDLYMPMRQVPPPGTPHRSRFSSKFMVDMMLVEVEGAEYAAHAVHYRDAQKRGRSLTTGLQSLARNAARPSSHNAPARPSQEPQSSDDEVEFPLPKPLTGDNLLKDLAGKLNYGDKQFMADVKKQPKLAAALKRDEAMSSDEEYTPQFFRGLQPDKQAKEAMPRRRRSEAKTSDEREASPTPGFFADMTSGDEGEEEEEGEDVFVPVPQKGKQQAERKHSISPLDQRPERSPSTSALGRDGTSKPGMGPGEGPGMGKGVGKGMGPGFGEGMGPGMGPGMGKGLGPGKGPGMGDGSDRAGHELNGFGVGVGASPYQGELSEDEARGDRPGKSNIDKFGVGYKPPFDQDRFDQRPEPATGRPGKGGSGRRPSQAPGYQEQQPDEEEAFEPEEDHPQGPPGAARQPQPKPVGRRGAQPRQPDRGEGLGGEGLGGEGYPEPRGVEDEQEGDLSGRRDSLKQGQGAGRKQPELDEDAATRAMRRSSQLRRPSISGEPAAGGEGGAGEPGPEGPSRAAPAPKPRLPPAEPDQEDWEGGGDEVGQGEHEPAAKPRTGGAKKTPAARPAGEDHGEEEEEEGDQVKLAVPKPRRKQPQLVEEEDEEPEPVHARRPRKPAEPEDDEEEEEVSRAKPKREAAEPSAEPVSAPQIPDTAAIEEPAKSVQPPPPIPTQPAPPPAAEEPEQPKPKPKPTPPPPPPPPVPTPTPPLVDDPNRIKVKHGFHWSDIKDKKDLSGTLWADMDGQEELDVHKFEDLFCLDPRSEKRKFSRLTGDGTSGSPAPSTTPAIIDIRRANNIGIGMSRFYKRFNTSEIRDKIVQHAAADFSLDDLYALRDIMPTPAEQKMFSDYDGPPEALVPAEQFLKEMSKEPGVGWMTESMLLEKAFEADLKHCTEKIDTTAKVLNKLVDSKDLKRVLKTTLDLGNLTNYDYGRAVQRSKAHGFRVDSLPNLKDVWAVDRESNLTHYLSMLTAKKNPEALDMHKQFPELKKARGFDLKAFLKTVDALKGQVDVVRQAKGAPNTPQLQRFHASMQPFVQKADRALADADATIADYQRAWTKALGYFGEKDANIKPEEMFGYFEAFMSDLDTATRQISENKVKVAKTPVGLRSTTSLSSLTD